MGASGIKQKPLSKNHTFSDWLVHVGLPMFVTDLRDVNVTDIRQLSQLSEETFKHIGIFERQHVQKLLKVAREYVNR